MSGRPRRTPRSWPAASLRVAVPRAVLAALAAVVLAPVALALAHGAASQQYRTTIVAVEPPDLPIDVRMVGDRIRFENRGDRQLSLCGYEATGCDPWVRIGADGVFVDRNSPAYHVNASAKEYGGVPDGAGEGPAQWHRVRRAPPFYAYHDHRVHWMGGSTLPPNVDARDPSAQHVYDGKVRFRFGDVEGTVRTRLDYVGGRTFVEEYWEVALMVAGVALMVTVFLVDARRRRRAAQGRSADLVDG